MGRPKNHNIVILKLHYDPSIASGREVAIVTEKTEGLKGSNSEVRQWFYGAVTHEVSKIPEQYKPYYREWEISTSDCNLFILDGFEYENVYVVLGEENVHWNYYTTNDSRRYVWGLGELDFSFCGCCLDSHYTKIMQIILKKASPRML